MSKTTTIKVDYLARVEGEGAITARPLTLQRASVEFARLLTR